jgi:nucleoid-associated protein YgaU
VALLAMLGVPAGTVAAQTLKGSRGSVERMYGQARRQDLTFYRSGRGVRNAAAEGELVRLGGNDDYRIAAASYPYALPTTRTFVQRLASQYHDYCGEKLVVTSATRPKSIHLPNSVAESVHPSGMAVDIRKPTRGRCLRWLRQRLLDVESEGVIDATEEHHPPHFHVAVFPAQYRRYVDANSGSGSGSRRRAASSGERSSSGRTTYRVREGDSLWTIARRTGVSVARIKEANGMSSSKLSVGQRIVIPSR